MLIHILLLLFALRSVHSIEITDEINGYFRQVMYQKVLPFEYSTNKTYVGYNVIVTYNQSIVDPHTSTRTTEDGSSKVLVYELNGDVRDHRVHEWCIAHPQEDYHDVFSLTHHVQVRATLYCSYVSDNNTTIVPNNSTQMNSFMKMYFSMIHSQITFFKDHVIRVEVNKSVVLVMYNETLSKPTYQFKYDEKKKTVFYYVTETEENAAVKIWCHEKNNTYVDQLVVNKTYIGYNTLYCNGGPLPSLEPEEYEIATLSTYIKYYWIALIVSLFLIALTVTLVARNWKPKVVDAPKEDISLLVLSAS